MRFFGLSLPKQAALIHLSTGLLGTAIGVCATTGSARAQASIISNLDQAASGLTMFTTTSDRFAESFTTSADYSSSVYATLNLALQSSTISTSDTVHAYLYSDGIGSFINGAYVNSDQPVSQIADLGTVSVNSTTAANYTFSSTSSISLMGNQQYWLVLQDDVNSNAGWTYTTSTTYTGPGTINSDAATGSSPNGGNSWLIEGLNYTDPNSGQTIPYGAQLFGFGSEMPEPCSLPLFAAGAFGGGVLVSSRRQLRSRLRIQCGK